MTPKLQKASLFVILGLLIIFLPATVYGMYLKKEKIANTNKLLTNEKKELFYNGRLWFYDEKGELLGTYVCEHTFCDIGESVENDSEYAIDSYISEEQVKLPIINNQYVFLKDSDEETSQMVFLHDIKNNLSYKNKSYYSVKNYQVGLKDNLFIVEDINHLFGVLAIDEFATMRIKNNYNFIGVANLGFENDKLISDFFVAEKNNSWSILDAKEGGELARNLKEQIVTFTGEYIITKDELLNYHVYDYDNKKALEEDFQNLFFVGRFLACQINDEFYIYDLKNQVAISNVHSVRKNDIVEADINSENKLEIKVNGKIKESIPVK